MRAELQDKTRELVIVLAEAVCLGDYAPVDTIKRLIGEIMQQEAYDVELLERLRLEKSVERS